MLYSDLSTGLSLTKEFLVEARYHAAMTTRIAVTLPDEQVFATRQAVADGRARSVSAYVADALAQQMGEDRFVETLAEMRAEVGEPSDEDYAWAKQALGIA